MPFIHQLLSLTPKILSIKFFNSIMQLSGDKYEENSIKSLDEYYKKE